jgi:hypothetical protein
MICNSCHVKSRSMFLLDFLLCTPSLKQAALFDSSRMQQVNLFQLLRDDFEMSFFDFLLIVAMNLKTLLVLMLTIQFTFKQFQLQKVLRPFQYVT